MKLVRDQERQEGQLPSQPDLDQQGQGRRDGKYADDGLASSRPVPVRLEVGVDASPVIDQRVLAEDHSHQNCRDHWQHRAGEDHGMDGKTVDQRATGARAQRLRHHPLRREQRKARGAKSCVQRCAEI